MLDNNVSDYNRAHQIASKVFKALNLSYIFSSCLIAPMDGDHILRADAERLGLTDPTKRTVCRFTFCKPQHTKPLPDIAVDLYCEFLAEAEDGTWRYLIRAEGQRFNHVVTAHPDRVTGQEFREAWIDKVYEQKAALRKNRLWEQELADL